MISFCVLWCNHDVIGVQVVQLSLTRWPEGCTLPFPWMRFRRRMGRGRRRGRRRRRERQTALKRKVELVNRHSSSLPHTSLTITPCTPHTYTHTLTSSHPHTSLCHPLIFHIQHTHPHLLTPSHITLSHPVSHILTTHTPSPPPTLTHHSVTP